MIRTIQNSKQKKILLFYFLAIIVMFGTLSNTYKTTSSGAPLGSTGAPGEFTCAKSGCHDDNNNLNTGSGVLTLDLGTSTYKPGKVYNISVSLEQSLINRFGFQLLALNENDTTNAGTFIITEDDRTQIMAGVNQYAGRNYITYKAKGTDAISPGLGRWTLQWKAPQYNAGNVIFYLSCIAANDDATDKGDLVYTKTVFLQSAPLGINGATNATNEIVIFPAPAKTFFTVNYFNNSNALTTIVLFDMQGKRIGDLYSSFQFSAQQTLELGIPDYISKGYYYVQIENGFTTLRKKLYVE